MDPSVVRIVEFLNREKIRATYEAVAYVADVSDTFSWTSYSVRASELAKPRKRFALSSFA